MTDDELLDKLGRWLASLPAPPSIFEVIQTGDSELFAAFVLKAFRIAAREAVLDRLRQQSASMDPEHRNPADGVFCVFERLSAAWSLTDLERNALLGVEDHEQIAMLRSSPDDGLPITVIERLAILLDIFEGTEIDSCEQESPVPWIRRPNRAKLFGGAAPLNVMLTGLDGLRQVRAHLTAQRYRR